MRPSKGQICVFENALWVVSGYKMDPNFVCIERIDKPEEHTVHNSMIWPIGLKQNEIGKCKTVKELKDKYPEYII